MLSTFIYTDLVTTKLTFYIFISNWLFYWGSWFKKFFNFDHYINCYNLIKWNSFCRLVSGEGEKMKTLISLAFFVLAVTAYEEFRGYEMFFSSFFFGALWLRDAKYNLLLFCFTVTKSSESNQKVWLTSPSWKSTSNLTMMWVSNHLCFDFLFTRIFNVLVISLSSLRIEKSLKIKRIILLGSFLHWVLQFWVG